MIPNLRFWDRELKKMWTDDDITVERMKYFDESFYGDFSIVQLKHLINCSKKTMDIMQSTGLKDKNNKEIFEGDILGGYPNGTVFVRWCKEYACFESVSYEDEEDDDGAMVEKEQTCLFANDLKDCFDEWSVIGNIHENPELLKEDKTNDHD